MNICQEKKTEDKGKKKQHKKESSEKSKKNKNLLENFLAPVLVRHV
jgi:hypothetical protein